MSQLRLLGNQLAEFLDLLTHVVETTRLTNLCIELSPILISFDKTQKFRAVIYFTFEVLLQEK